VPLSIKWFFMVTATTILAASLDYQKDSRIKSGSRVTPSANDIKTNVKSAPRKERALFVQINFLVLFNHHFGNSQSVLVRADKLNCVNTCSKIRAVNLKNRCRIPYVLLIDFCTKHVENSQGS